MKSISIGRQYRVPAALAVSTAVIMLAVLGAPVIYRQLNDWKLLPQPERLTELYYQNHTTLPASFTPGSPQMFSFTAHNLEYRDTNYRYSVTAQPADSTQSVPLASGSFRLPQNAYKTSQVTFVPSENMAQAGTTPNPRVQIITTLYKDGRQFGSESIHYWVTAQAAAPVKGS